MREAGKLAHISAFETQYSLVEALLVDIGPEELRFVPPHREAWSINDFLVHFLDADIGLAFRVRKAIAEPGEAAPAWDEAAWHDALRYEAEDGLACLAFAKRIRAYISVGLRSVVDEDWSRFTILHATKGRVELGALIAMYEQHLVFHLPLIRRNRQAWLHRRG
jgi:hypothetical protein